MLDYREAASLEEASRLLAADSDALALAGGTAVGVMLTQELIAPTLLVSLRKLTGLRGIHQDGDTLRIGACTTLTDVAASPAVRAVAPSLAVACARVGNQRVRNLATLGGAVAEGDYASDPLPAAASLGATCAVHSPTGVRELPADQVVTGFYENSLGDGELITEIRVPVVPARRAAYLKFQTRSSEDRACVGVAARVDLEPDGVTVADLDVVVGAVAATLQRVPAALDDARGRALDDAVIAAVAGAYAAAVDPIEDARGTTWYRTRMIEVLTGRALHAIRPDRPHHPDAGDAHA